MTSDGFDSLDTTGGIGNSVRTMLTIQRQTASGTSSGEVVAQETGSTLDLAGLTDSISLSAIDPRLRAVLEDISDRGGNVIDVLENNINTLQDGFLETLHSRLENAGVSLEHKITLALDGTESLQLTNAHPDADTITTVLENSPDLRDAFQEIAGQSELVRDIRNIRKVVGSRGGAAQYAEVAAMENNGAESYAVSMRGTFSHFYFASGA